jgi:aspartokinase/homoserine dehydrogenase 1
MERKIIINKFGGSILNANFFPLILARIKNQIENNYQPIIVVSALPGVTDELLNNCQQKNFLENFKKKHFQVLVDINLNSELQIKAKNDLEEIFIKLEKDIKQKNTQPLCFEDQRIAYGEKLSSIILSYYLNANNLPAQVFLAEEIGIITDNNFKNANIDFSVSSKNIKKTFSSFKKIPIIPGFTGKTIKNQTTTLGRGGTDTTACFIGSVLKAEKIILWKDVGGVLSADPKIVKEAYTIPHLSYQEAEEAGKIIHEKAVQYPKLNNTLIEIRSIRNPKLKTQIDFLKKEKKGAKIVSFKKDLNLFLITDEKTKGVDLLFKVSSIFQEHQINIILISNTPYSLQIVAENLNNQTEKVFQKIKKEVQDVKMHPVSMVFLIGSFNLQDVNDFNSLLIDLKTDMEISAFLYKNCTRIEAIIQTKEIEKIIRALYKKFISNQSR